jgi:hypothetical protein
MYTSSYVQSARRSPFAWIVLASLALHGLALWAMSGDVSHRAAPSRAMELSWIENDRAAQQPEEAPKTAPPQTQPPQPPTKKKKATEASASPAQQPSGGGTTSEAPDVAATASGTASEVGDRGDMPLAKGRDLTPGLGFVLKLPHGKTGQDAQAGTTVMNGPGEEPDQVVAKEVEGERLTRKLNSELQQDVGEVAVAVGTVPGHFRQVETSMRASLAKAPLDRTPKSVGDEVRDIARIALTPGVSAQAARNVTDSPMGRSITNNSVMMPNVEDSRSREAAMQMMGAAEAIKERMHAPQLKTVLEMTTDASGGLADVTVVEKSGDPRFDESVIHLSRKVFRSLPENDDKALGTSWWRTRWQFTYEPPDVKVRLLGAHRVSPQ